MTTAHHNLVVHAFFVATMFVLALTLFVLATVRKRPRRWMILAPILVAWLCGFWYVRLHTGVGILVLGGANHWIAKAIESPDDRQAAEILKGVLLSSNYGVNAAETAVLRRSDACEQVRMFELLATVAPWENWKETYRMRAETARQRGSGCHARSTRSTPGSTDRTTCTICGQCSVHSM